MRTNTAEQDRSDTLGLKPLPEWKTGIIKWFDPDRGFGFIVPDTGGLDVFFHWKTLRKYGLRGVDANEGVPVKFVFRNSDGPGRRPEAVQIVIRAKK